MTNTEVDINAIIEELGNQVAALTVENSVLKARIRAMESQSNNTVQNTKTIPEEK